MVKKYECLLWQKQGLEDQLRDLKAAALNDKVFEKTYQELKEYKLLLESQVEKTKVENKRILHIVGQGKMSIYIC